MEVYSVLRWIFSVGSIILILIIAKKFKKKALAIICGFAILIGVVAWDLHFPVENHFIHFKTAQQAFSYYNNGEILNVIEGKKSALVVYKGADSIGTSILHKKDIGWQINPLFSFDTVYNKKIIYKNVDCDIVIFQAKNTKDFYVNINFWFVGEKPIVSDNMKSSFWCVEEPDLLTAKNSYSFYGYVEDINNQYQIQVNSETVDIKIGDIDFSNAITD